MLESNAPKYSARLNSTFVSVNVALFALKSVLKIPMRLPHWVLKVKPVHLDVREKLVSLVRLERPVCPVCLVHPELRLM